MHDGDEVVDLVLGGVCVPLVEPDVPQQRLGPVQQEGGDGHGVQPVDRDLHGAAGVVLVQRGRERGPADWGRLVSEGGRAVLAGDDVLHELLEGFARDRAAVLVQRDVGELPDGFGVHAFHLTLSRGSAS